jgi:hypothetical protein
MAKSYQVLTNSKLFEATPLSAGSPEGVARAPVYQLPATRALTNTEPPLPAARLWWGGDAALPLPHIPRRCPKGDLRLFR